MKLHRAVGICGLASLYACTLISGADDLTISYGERTNADGSSPASTNATSVDGASGVEDGGALDASVVDGASEGGSSPDGSILDCAPSSDPSLLVHYAFDDGTGAKVKDCTGRGHEGTIVGTPVWTIGKHGGALSFNGTDSCVDLGAGADLRLGTFTITAWVDVALYTTSGLNGHILGKTAGNPNVIGWRFATVASPNLFEAKLAVNGGTPFSIASPGGQPTGTWIHVGFVLAPQRADVYVGGVRVAHDAAPPSIYEDAVASMRVGCNGGAKDYFKGAMDEVRVYTRALSDAEVAALAK